MGKDQETMIRARARAIWEEEGRPDGSALRHWLEAERQVMRDRDAQGDAVANDPAVSEAAADRSQPAFTGTTPPAS